MVPAHDEQELLGACLVGLQVAAAGLTVPVHLLVVLDACTDRSAEVAAAAGVATLVVPYANVGATRAAGVSALRQALGPEDWWLATTDADSVVGPTWLQRQLWYAAHGFDAVAGTVQIAWRDSTDVRTRYQQDYHDRWDHRHVHGANLGLRIETYLAVGGFTALAEHEDVALVERMVAGGHPIAWAADVPVRTSGRHLGRTPGGLSGLLDALAETA